MVKFKRLKFFIFYFLFLILLTGCGYKGPIMDQPIDGGSYQYYNDSLKFSLVLPPEFQYYQTQRKEAPSYVDIEFFVPTSDTGYRQEVTGYVKVITVRVYELKDGQGGQAADDSFEPLGESQDRRYFIGWWRDIPVDWQHIWNQEMRDNILGSFAIN